MDRRHPRRPLSPRRTIPGPCLNGFAALALTAANYTILTAYDLLAFRLIGRTTSRWRIAITSFLGYAVANNVGFAVVSGTAVRYRFYSRWGVTADELPRIVLFYSSGFWLGLLALGGLSLALGPAPPRLPLPPAGVAGIGWTLVGATLLYVGAAYRRVGTLTVRGAELSLPPFGYAVAQLAISIADWTLAASVL